MPPWNEVWTLKWLFVAVVLVVANTCTVTMVLSAGWIAVSRPNAAEVVGSLHAVMKRTAMAARHFYDGSRLHSSPRGCVSVAAGNSCHHYIKEFLNLHHLAVACELFSLSGLRTHSFIHELSCCYSNTFLHESVNKLSIYAVDHPGSSAPLYCWLKAE